VAEFGLVMPFLTDDPAFAHGVEFGMLYARMTREGGERVIEGHFLIGNEEQITLAANRLGWRVTGIDHGTEGWVFVRLERR
jgi:hypothetical protein